MTVSINVSTRFPAYATSMGRVLLAALDDAALDAYLAGVELRPLSPRTTTSPEALRAELAGSAARAGRWSTRSSKKACAPSRPRSATAGAAVGAVQPVRTRAG